MKNIYAAFIAICVLFIPTLLLAQNTYSVTGKIADNEGKPLDAATVYLLRAADSAVVKTALADNGAFVFNHIQPGNYRISVSMTGFQPYKSAIITLDQDKPLAPITLSVTNSTLREVIVSAQRQFVQQKIDRVVVNPEALISNAGSTALEILEKAPGVMVDQNGAISLKGKGVTIFIDDKPTYLSGDDLQNYLRSLTSSTIDQIELMPNPPARYDAAGNGGVINIRTKKNQVKGFNGSINMNYLQGRYAKTNESINLNYRRNKLNIFTNLSYNYYNNYNDLDIYRHFLNGSGAVVSNFAENSYIRNMGSNLLAKIGADYYISDKSTIGINLSGIYNPRKTITPVTSNFTNAAGAADSTILAHNEQHGVFKNGGINLNYRHQYNKDGRQLSADADYLAYYNNSDQSFQNSSYTPGGALKSSDLLTGSLPAHINIYSFKADYDYPLKSGWKLSTGVKTSYTNTDNIANYFYTLSGVTAPDYGKTNHFIYKENINAAYLNANKDFKKLSIQAGIRLENTVSDGHQLGNMQKPDSTFKRNYTSLFPTLYLQYKLGTAGHHVLGLNYGRRIDRPYYQDLNPFLSPLDKFTYYTGNPFLNPSYTDNIELSHTFRNRFTTTLTYGRTHNDVAETIEIVNGIYYSRPGNIGQTTEKSLSFDGTVDPAKWLNIHFYGNVSQLHSVSDFYTGPLDTKGTYFVLRPAFSFKFANDWAAQLDGNYQSKIVSTQFDLGSRGRVNAGVSKKLSPSTTVKIVMNDIFYTNKNTGIINNLNNTLANWRNLGDSRLAILSLSYRFGKAISNQRQHQTNGAESEQNRVKN